MEPFKGVGGEKGAGGREKEAENHSYLCVSLKLGTLLPFSDGPRETG